METLSRRKLLTGLAAALAAVGAVGARALGGKRRDGARSGEGGTAPGESPAPIAPTLTVRPAPRTVKRRG